MNERRERERAKSAQKGARFEAKKNEVVLSSLPSEEKKKGARGELGRWWDCGVGGC